MYDVKLDDTLAHFEIYVYRVCVNIPHSITFSKQ